jgi:type II secretion system protein G
MKTLKMLKDAKGFTLIEIMIVVLIIGILLAIAIPNFMTARDESRTNSCIANLEQINAAKEQYAMDNKLNDGAAAPATTDLQPKYIQGAAFPSCPANGTYAINAIGTNPTCTVTGHAMP